VPLRRRPFEENDLATLISWVPTADVLWQWCAAFFAHPLDDAQLSRYRDSARTPSRGSDDRRRLDDP
jgi:hypothetical protein